jgi:hypothetical protein
MRTIRRLYLYAVAFVSLEVVLWGLIGLARSAFGGQAVGQDAGSLAGALSLILVGVPVFFLHWWLAQRSASDDAEERSSRVRAVFLYGGLLATLIPVTQNALTLINSGFLQLFDIPPSYAIFGEAQRWSDNLIAITFNALTAAYLYSILRTAQQQVEGFQETRRFYRYLWMLYGVSLTVGGVYSILQFLLGLGETLGMAARSNLSDGLALLVVGVPVWVLSLRVLQNSLSQPEEQQSQLRLVVLYALNFFALGSVLITGGLILDVLLRLILGETLSFTSFLAELRDPFSLAIPMAGMWGFYGRTLQREVNQLPDSPRRASLRRFYFYILAAVGLGATFIGLRMLLAFILDFSLDEKVIWEGALREELAAALATLLVALPLWFLAWRPLSAEAAQVGETGDHARRSLVRRSFLYLALFAGILGVMFSTGVLIFDWLSTWLGDRPENLLRETLDLLVLLLLFGGILTYHGLALRTDNRRAAQALSARHAAFPVLVLAVEIGEFTEEIVSALRREAPAMPVAVHVAATGIPDETLSAARAVVLPADLVVAPPEAIRLWLRNFEGMRLVIPSPVVGWWWPFGSGRPLSNLVRQAARMVRALSEGEEFSQVREIASWQVALYVLLGLISLPILVSLIADLVVQ